MTKKEKQQLNQSRCIVEREGNNQFIVAFCLTAGEFLSLKNALSAWKTAVGADNDNALTRAAYKVGVEL